MTSLIEMECYDINERDILGRTPLAWAARNRHEEVVKMLLGREEVDPDVPDNDGQTPLSFAAEYGSKGVLQILLELRKGVFFVPIPEKRISDFIAHGSIIQVFTVLELRISHHGNRARQVDGVGDQPLLTGISELVRWHSLCGTRQFPLVL